MGNSSSKNTTFHAVVPVDGEGKSVRVGSSSSSTNTTRRIPRNATAPLDTEIGVSNNEAGPQNFPIHERGSNVTSNLTSCDDTTDNDLMMESAVTTKISPQKPVDENNNSGFDFRLTEGQSRRNAMADCETECSKVTDYLFVGGHKVAQSLNIINQHGITQVINCSAAVVCNYFTDIPGMTYLTLNMVDGRQDDVTWFVCEIIKFIIKGRDKGLKTLLHCEKGVSRSCSFAIAYVMWENNMKWKDSFNFVKQCRIVCAPNTAFTCNLIEFEDLLRGEAESASIVLRCAEHLPFDSTRPVLKICRKQESRQLISPSTSHLDPRGVFVIRPPGGRSSCDKLYVWQGNQASDVVVNIATVLAEFMSDIFVMQNPSIICVKDGSEEEAFFKFVENDHSFNINNRYDDVYTTFSVDGLKNLDTEQNLLDLSSGREMGGGDLTLSESFTLPSSASKNCLILVSEETLSTQERTRDAVSPSSINCYRQNSDGENLPDFGSSTNSSASLHIDAPASTTSSSSPLKLSLPASLVVPSGDSFSKVTNSNSALRKDSSKEIEKKTSNPAIGINALPIYSIESEISPSIRERHPDFVDVLRGPTSIEELVPSRSNELIPSVSKELIIPSRPQETITLTIPTGDKLYKMAAVSPMSLTLPTLSTTEHPRRIYSTGGSPQGDTRETVADPSASTTRVDKREGSGSIENTDSPTQYGDTNATESGDKVDGHFLKLKKPKLFQAQDGVWSDMGIYDEQDLDNVRIMLC